MRGIRQPNVKNLQELDTLEPKDKWIVRVEDEDSDFYYDGEKAAWIEIPCSSTNYIRYDEDDKLASNKLMFNTIDINELVLYLIIMVCIIGALLTKHSEVASMLAGVLSGRASGLLISPKKNK